MAAGAHHRVLILGGGTAGISVAASLRRRSAKPLDIAIVEPAANHYYQPAFTLVGAGAYSLAKTRRAVESLVPSGVRLIRSSAKTFEPAANALTLANGDRITYDYLVVATGLKLDWDKVAGLAETIGRNGVTSNYAPEYAPYTWELLKNLKSGAKAVFTQPPLPFKCPGAPQKIVYLTADYLQKKGLLESCDVRFFTAAPTIFGVAYFAKELVKIAARYGATVHYQHNLVAVDGAAKAATFEILGGDKQGQRVSLPFDMLHVTPPQSPHNEIKSSPLANAAGFVEVDQNSMQHVRFANVFALGDVASSPNSKTAAAVRKQSPVVVRNILRLMSGEAVEKTYDGYASCPLTTAYGKAILAEFIYGGKVTPSLPLDPAKERWINWWIKVTALPIMYWHYMLKGREWFPGHNKNFKGDAAPS